MSQYFNPYQDVDWGKGAQIHGTTHMHCTTAKHLRNVLAQGMEFVTISNYYPSRPYYPLAEIRENQEQCGQQGGIKNGAYTKEYLDFNEIIGKYAAELSPEIRSEIPFRPGKLLFPDLPDSLLEAPNAEHHYFSDATIFLHITSPGAMLTSGNFDLHHKFQLEEHGYPLGMPVPWKEGFREIFDSLIIPDGGGIIINHPSWSHLPMGYLEELLDFDPRVIGIEIYNHGCHPWRSAESLTEWDQLLSTGRRCFGFCVPDHSTKHGEWWGRTILLPEERSAESCLRAMRLGRFYGAARGGVGLRFEEIRFDGSTLYARCNRPVYFQLLSKSGVADELYDSVEYRFTLPESARETYVFLRLTAGEPEKEEVLFAQPILLTPRIEIEVESSYNRKEKYSKNYKRGD